MKKYICYGGKVRSENDRQIHYITARTIARLYNVNLSQCILVDEDGREDPTHGIADGLIPLYPDSSGKYELPNK